MRKLSLTFMAVFFLQFAALAQEFGLSFSYFLPRDGYFSIPISPFSIRGLGVNVNRFIALETGATLYRMSGLNLKDLPFESKDPLMGPNFTVFIPAELVIQLPAKSFQFDLKGGGFFFYCFDNKINYGNFDKSIRTYEAWVVANSDLTFKHSPGLGWHAGVELTVYPSNQFGISLEVNYLMGQAKFPLKGSYTGADISSTLETVLVDYSDSKIDFTGLEVSLGIILKGSGGGAPKKRKR